DGSKIHFTRAISIFYHTIYTIKPYGTELRTLESAGDETDAAPAWSPTGDKIAFQSYDYANWNDIRIANADGSGREYFDKLGASEYGNADKPDWSPDGNQIVYYVALGR